MGSSILVIPDSHAHPNFNNDRADWLSQFIIASKPDIVVHIGDSADMPSLSLYDKGKKSFHGRTYKADINAHLDFQDRLWEPIKARKKRLPRRVFCVGNHEHRISRAVEFSPELEGAISLGDLELDYFYDDVVHYNGSTPGVIEVEGISFAHYFTAGNTGRAIATEHSAYTLLSKNFTSSVAGHSHLLDLAVRTDNNGRKLMGAVVGCYQDYDADWAGESNKKWSRGVALLKNVENGQFDFNWIGLDTIKKEFGA